MGSSLPTIGAVELPVHGTPRSSALIRRPARNCGGVGPSSHYAKLELDHTRAVSVFPRQTEARTAVTPVQRYDGHGSPRSCPRFEVEINTQVD
jgi:hypothetical protein